MSACKRMLVKAVGINAADIQFATNYNESECKNIPGQCGCIHAEEALLKKMPNPEVVVVTCSPCLNCAKLLVEHEVKEVRYGTEYRLKDGIEYLKANGVEVIKI